MDCNLLLVDDEPNVPRSIRRALRHEGYNVFIANSGDTALELLRDQPIDIILSDHRMPGMTGAELLTEVSRSYPETVRIMLSGQADMNDVVQAVNEGSIYKFLTKPWSNDTLRSIIKEAAAISKTRTVKEASGSLHDRFSNPLNNFVSPARLIVLEVRNASVMSFLSDIQTENLLEQITQRCAAVTGALHQPIAAIEETLFGMVTPLGEHEQMTQLAQTITQPFYLGDQIAPLRLAVGYADQVDAEDAEHWLRRALIALTATSFSGEVTAYSENVQDDLHERHSLERDMRNGLGNEEFFLQAQPQVCGETLKIKGAECLCRWKHPSRGLISPMKFIDLAEQNGFIHELGAWVIGESCDLLSTLHERGIDDVKVSFNVSPRQFSLPGWTDTVLEFVQRSPVNPALLEIEITESTVMDNPEHAQRVMSDLKKAGVSLAMVDFGTGHSSLSLINELPIDVLKFDRSLLCNIDTDKHSRILFSRLVDMTHELGLESIAEGVETPEQIALCQNLGCTLIQGYAFYKPVALSEFFKLLDGGQGERH